eukprot:gene6895-6120_t
MTGGGAAPARGTARRGVRSAPPHPRHPPNAAMSQSASPVKMTHPGAAGGKAKGM